MPNPKASRDVGDIPVPLLVVRNLDALTTDDTLFRSFADMGPIKEVRIVRDRLSNLSWGFGFVELYDVQTAAQMLSSILQNPDFLLDGRKVDVAYAHQSSFIPVYSATSWVSTSYQDAYGNVVYLQYWDEQAYATSYVQPGYVATTITTSAPEIPSNSKPPPKKKKTKAAAKAVQATVSVEKLPEVRLDDELAAFYSDVSALASDPKSEKLDSIYVVPGFQKSESGREDVQSGSSQHNSISGSPPLPSISYHQPPGDADVTFIRSKSHMDGKADRDDSQGLAGSSQHGKDKKKIGGAPPSRKMQVQLQKWSEKQEELAVLKSEEEEEIPPETTFVDLSDEALMQQLPSEEAVNEQHRDLTLMACLLCQRQFKGPEELRKHQSRSELHKTNMATFRQQQLAELRTQLETQQYRNRAAERRKRHGQPKPKSTKRQERPIKPEQPVNPLGEDNIGNRLLRSLGWKEGEGLGARGTGIVAPIEAEGYAPGAGLGSTSRY
ncbi:hypothetical protein HK102_000035 [Quaeritorhiza haematococci]|nr:hypothetical protein HK102_000035 [Quaeritorhiza haematococci]